MCNTSTQGAGKHRGARGDATTARNAHRAAAVRLARRFRCSLAFAGLPQSVELSIRLHAHPPRTTADDVSSVRVMPMVLTIAIELDGTPVAKRLQRKSNCSLGVLTLLCVVISHGPCCLRPRAAGCWPDGLHALRWARASLRFDRAKSAGERSGSNEGKRTDERANEAQR